MTYEFPGTHTLADAFLHGLVSKESISQHIRTLALEVLQAEFDHAAGHKVIAMGDYYEELYQIPINGDTIVISTAPKQPHSETEDQSEIFVDPLNQVSCSINRHLRTFAGLHVKKVSKQA